MIINEIFSTVLQIVVFSLIPFIAYLFNRKKWNSFLQYVGLKRSNTKANLYAAASSLIIGLPFLILCIANTEFREILFHPESMTGKFRAMGFSATSLFLVLLTAILKTALSEEIFFRGFLAKRLIIWLGFQSGNLLQAIIFGVIHTLIFLSISSNIFFLILIFIFPAIGAYVMAYINEKMAEGSIIPSWISHALANIIAYSSIGFLL